MQACNNKKISDGIFNCLWSTNTHQPSCYFELGMGLWHICKIHGRLSMWGSFGRFCCAPLSLLTYMADFVGDLNTSTNHKSMNHFRKFSVFVLFVKSSKKDTAEMVKSVKLHSQ